MIDLHVHTSNSDGNFTTEETIIEAGKQGVDILSITDHNNVSAYNDIKRIPVEKYFSGIIITGTELEFVKEGRLFDMLGYGFNLDLIKNAEIIQKGMIHSTIEGETKILNQLKSICDRLGIIYSKDLHIESANNMANDVLLDDIIIHEENIETLIKLGIYDRSTFYRQHFCEPSSPFYIDQTEGKYDVFYVVKIIREAGGKTFLAHPFVYKLTNLKEFLDDLVSNNLLDGIECEHRKHTPEQIEWLKKYCDEHGLLKSGGSDRHTVNHLMGHSNNNKKVIEEELIHDWIYSIESIYSPSNNRYFNNSK